MKRTVLALQVLAGFVLVAASIPALGKTHNEMFNVSCDVLWPAVKDTLRNSGKYGIIGIDNSEKTASYNIGGYLGGKRINSLVLNPRENNCEMQIQTSYSGLIHNDEGDFRKRVEESLAKLQVAKANPSSKPVTISSPPGTSQEAASEPAPSAMPQKP